MIDFLTIILLVFGVLQIILFFKVWGMTNDIKEIRSKYLKDEDEKEERKRNMTQTLRLAADLNQRCKSQYQHSSFVTKYNYIKAGLIPGFFFKHIINHLPIRFIYLLLVEVYINTRYPRTYLMPQPGRNSFFRYIKRSSNSSPSMTCPI